MSPQPTNQPDPLPQILLGLVGLAESIGLAFVKNKEHHASAADAIDRINKIAQPVAALIAEQQPK